MSEEFIEFRTDGLHGVQAGDGLYENRTATVEQLAQNEAAEVTILVQAYGRLEKTRRCIENVLKYTKNVDYELLLVDNGSTDETLEYFRSVPFPKKKIVHITENIGAAYPAQLLGLRDFSRFFCCLGNDIIVTAHWLENLLTCMKSDARTGMVVPVSSNISNLQEVALPFQNYDEMQQIAQQFNRSDPRKWEDRLRLITPAYMIRKEVLIALGWPLSDGGFFHDFIDDDMTFAIRRAGYRTVLAGDTWVCHDHDYRHGEGKDPDQFNKSLQIGRENFREKYFGLDAWEDVNNYYITYLRDMPAPKCGRAARVLGVDIRCGTPILDVKNWLRQYSVFDAELSAFTQDPKYWLDLKTICTGPVVCDREEFLTDSFPWEYFDYVVADRPLNCYHEPQKIINDLFALCKKGGIVICTVKNSFSFCEFLNLLGQQAACSTEFSYNMPLEAIWQAVEQLGELKEVIPIPFAMPEGQQQALKNLLPEELEDGARAEAVERMLCHRFVLIAEKK